MYIKRSFLSYVSIFYYLKLLLVSLLFSKNVSCRQVLSLKRMQNNLLSSEADFPAVKSFEETEIFKSLFKDKIVKLTENLDLQQHYSTKTNELALDDADKDKTHETFETINSSKDMFFGTNSTFFPHTNKTIPGLDYLGTGYDIVFGSPIGDPKEMIDPGYRAPIVQFTWLKNLTAVTNDLNTLQPAEGWVRSEVSCQRTETIEELNTLSDYQKQLSVDASLKASTYPSFSFSASASYKSFAHGLSNKKKKTVLMKTYCVRYAAELSSYVPWEYKEPYHNALKNLPRYFDGLKNTSKCQPFIYKTLNATEECKSIDKWMQFFKEYGTHVTSAVHLGGKLTNQYVMSKEVLSSLKERNINVAIGVDFVQGGGTASTSISNSNKEKDFKSNIEKTTIVIGGKPPSKNDVNNEFINWAASVAELPMPVKVSLLPLSYTMKFDHNLEKAYESALNYYGKVYGMTQDDINILKGENYTVIDKLRAGTQVTYAGPVPGSVVCPDKLVILLGWSLQSNFYNNVNNLESYHMTACEPGLEKCIGMGSKIKEYDDIRMWALCGEEQIFGQQQVVAESRSIASAQCPEGYTIGLGFGLSISDGHGGPVSSNMYACKAGMNSCSLETASGISKSYVWISCYDILLKGIKDIVNIVKLGDRGKVNTKKKKNDGVVNVPCKKNTRIIAGWAMEIHETFNDNRVREKFISCKKKDLCILRGSGYDGSGMFRTDSHALLGYISCGPYIEEKTAVTINKN